MKKQQYQKNSPFFENRMRYSKIFGELRVNMRGGNRKGAGRKKKPDHLRRIPVSIRLPKWMVTQIKMKGEIGYLIELELAKKKDFLDVPDDYLIGS